MLKTLIFTISTGLLLGMSQLGSVTGSVVDGLGKPLQGVSVLMECSHCETPIAEATTGQDGSYVLSNIRPGTYTIRFTVSGIGEKVLSNVAVKPGRLTSVARMSYGVDCSAPGINCDDFSYLRREFRLPCTIGLDTIKDERGQTKVFTWEELEPLVRFRPTPELPVALDGAEPITVYIVIGVNGKVLCANANMPNGKTRDRLLTTISTWRFDPILDQGRPKAIIGFVRLQRK